MGLWGGAAAFSGARSGFHILVRWRLGRLGERGAWVARREGEVEFPALSDRVGFFHFGHIMEGSRVIDIGQDEGGGYLDSVPWDIFLGRR